MRFYLETYGCALNAADSDMMVGRLHQMGAERVDCLEEADVAIVNTCGVKEPTEDRIIFRLSELSKCGVPVIVTGCLPKISLSRVKAAIPNFAAILGPQSIDSLGPIVLQVLEGQRGILHLTSDMSSKLQYFEGPPNSVICTIPICEGCLGNCAYCAVRLARSVVRSYSIDEIFQVALRSVHNGYREIRLTAQDAGAFGHDSGETLVNLLARLDTIPGEHRFRLGMFNPNLILDSLSQLLDIMSSNHFFKFFHIPVQSGSNSILRSMRRRYTVEEWIMVVETIRKRFPEASIATDIIVGFPGETDADFEATIEVIRQTHPQIVNISKYGDRPGTSASKAKNKVDTSLKKQRSRRLSLLVHDLVLQNHQAWLGWSGLVLTTDHASRGGVLARTDSYVPVIISEDVEVGIHLPVEIIGAERTHLLGRPQPRA
ncbi:MAG: tRNA (N(6)-L-threonylcarbamoyladenosine(37)-C(2))-methylthiotransferase [Candidatus Thorarchaeota archaeon]|nr:tRNA (N(6)-L-threonylcarbamoyladenosine(37)-C(2))-methylthiotransferase [Candidatus Thorarchaeota archaeon]